MGSLLFTHPDLVVILMVAGANLLTAIITAALAILTHISAKKTQADIRKVEIATNSMKDALVVATSEAAHAAGREEERAAGDARAATLAEGQDNKP